jgi:hypothetical protein
MSFVVHLFLRKEFLISQLLFAACDEDGEVVEFRMLPWLYYLVRVRVEVIQNAAGRPE